MNTESQRPPQKAVHVDHADGTFARGSEADAAEAPPGTEPQQRQRVQAAQTRLLNENAFTSVVASVLIALPLAYAHRRVISTLVISTWLLSVVVVAVLRWVLARRYWRASPGEASARGWTAASVAGTALAAAAWAIARDAVLRSHPPDKRELSRVHIAAVTGWGQDEDRRKAQEAGFDSHFTKPLAPAVVEELLGRVAHQSSAL